jgi:two-component system, LuxR family, sensor kinase FixL
MLDDVFLSGAIPAHAESGSYTILRVVLAYCLATIASYTALLLAHELVAARSSREKRVLHIGGALVLGTGLWSTLSMALLSHRTGLERSFHIEPAVLAWVIGVALAYGMFAATREEMPRRHILVGGVLFGLGVCAMQYVGIGAMQLDAALRLLPGYFVISVALAVLTGWTALWLAARLGRLERPDRVLYKLGGALALGGVIFLTCYAGLEAVVFLPSPQARRDPFQTLAGLTASVMGACALILLTAQAIVAYRAARTEARLRDSETKLRAVIDKALDALITTNAQGVIESFNPAAEKLFGYDSAEVIGNGIGMLAPEPQGGAEDEPLDRYFVLSLGRRNDGVNRELVARRKDGTTFPVELSVNAFRLHDGTHFFGIIRDISARREVENRARESVERARSIVDGALDAIIVVDENGSVTEWNNQAERTFGWPRQEVMGRAMAEMVIPEDRRSAHYAGMRRYLKEGTPVLIGKRIEVEARHRSGRIFAVDMAITVQKVQGRYSFTAFMRDISAQKIAETEREANIRALEASNRELDEFAYIVSHDLKEPLRGLRNHATFLLEDYGDRLDEDGARRLQRLVALGTRMQQLIEDLLFFSRLGRSELAVQPADPNAMVRDVEQMLDAFKEERHARIVVPQPMPVIFCDKTRVVEAFRNLITNALKYNDKEEPRIEVGYLPECVTLRGLEKHVFYVKDNGMGIPAEFHQEIFRMFKRLQRDEAGDQQGTGAGLTFVKKIVERHGGRIWLESEPGKGTTFFFTLPQPLACGLHEHDAGVSITPVNPPDVAA